MKAAPMMSSILIAACSASPTAQIVAFGPAAVMLDGEGFVADLQPVAHGAEVSVIRANGALQMHEGLLAKRIAQTFCGTKGQALDEHALGTFSAGSWIFAGGCQ